MFFKKVLLSSAVLAAFMVPGVVRASYTSLYAHFPVRAGAPARDEMSKLLGSQYLSSQEARPDLFVYEPIKTFEGQKIIEILRFWAVQPYYNQEGTRTYVRDKAVQKSDRESDYEKLVNLLVALFPSPVGSLEAVTTADSNWQKSLKDHPQELSLFLEAFQKAKTSEKSDGYQSIQNLQKLQKKSLKAFLKHVYVLYKDSQGNEIREILDSAINLFVKRSLTCRESIEAFYAQYYGLKPQEQKIPHPSVRFLGAYEDLSCSIPYKTQDRLVDNVNVQVWTGR